MSDPIIERCSHRCVWNSCGDVPIGRVLGDAREVDTCAGHVIPSPCLVELNCGEFAIVHFKVVSSVMITTGRWLPVGILEGGGLRWCHHVLPHQLCARVRNAVPLNLPFGFGVFLPSLNLLLLVLLAIVL